MLPQIDDSAWPIVRITYGEAISHAEIPQFGADLLLIFRERGPMVTVSDISKLNASSTTAIHRRLIAVESDRLAALGAFVAEAVIIRNPVTRFLYAGYLWAKQKQTYPSASFTAEDEALCWAREQLQRAARTRG